MQKLRATDSSFTSRALLLDRMAVIRHPRLLPGCPSSNVHPNPTPRPPALLRRTVSCAPSPPRLASWPPRPAEQAPRRPPPAHQSPEPEPLLVPVPTALPPSPVSGGRSSHQRRRKPLSLGSSEKPARTSQAANTVLAAGRPRSATLRLLPGPAPTWTA